LITLAELRKDFLQKIQDSHRPMGRHPYHTRRFTKQPASKSGRESIRLTFAIERRNVYSPNVRLGLKKERKKIDSTALSSVPEADGTQL
jgi:hypothetical protein